METTYTHVVVGQGGEILAACNGEPSRFGLEGAVPLDAPAKFDPATYYIKAGELCAMPPKPSARALFDFGLGQWTEPPFTEEETALAWIELRRVRALLLSASDWTQAPDAPVDQDAWAAYRQALRDLPANTADPHNPIWPVPPEK